MATTPSSHCSSNATRRDVVLANLSFTYDLHKKQSPAQHCSERIEAHHSHHDPNVFVEVFVAVYVRACVVCAAFVESRVFAAPCMLGVNDLELWSCLASDWRLSKCYPGELSLSLSLTCLLPVFAEFLSTRFHTQHQLDGPVPVHAFNLWSVKGLPCWACRIMRGVWRSLWRRTVLGAFVSSQSACAQPPSLPRDRCHLSCAN